MRPIGVTLLFVLTLAAGIVIGWQLPRSPVESSHRGTDPTHSITFRGASTPPTAAATVDLHRAPAVSAAPSVADRLAMMRWFQQNGLAISPSLFLNEKVTPEFAQLYELDSAQTERINQLYQHAREAFDLLKQKHARRDPASTPAKLIVIVPPLPAEGGEIYRRFVGDFAAVLGPELTESFNEISGDVLEGAFGGFGLEANRYEITREPAVNGWQFYPIKRSFAPSAITTARRPFAGEVLGRMSAEDLRESYPALAKFDLPTVDTVGP